MWPHSRDGEAHTRVGVVIRLGRPWRGSGPIQVEACATDTMERSRHSCDFDLPGPVSMHIFWLDAVTMVCSAPCWSAKTLSGGWAGLVSTALRSEAHSDMHQKLAVPMVLSRALR